MDLVDIGRAVRKGWYLVVVALLLGVGLAVLRVETSSKVYESTLTLYVSINHPARVTSQSISDDQAAVLRAGSYVSLASSERLGDLVVKATGVNLTASQVASRISSAVRTNTVLLDVGVRDTDRARSLRIAQGVSQQFPVLVSSLDDSNSPSTVVTLSTVSGPTLHTSPVSPRVDLDIGLGVIGGLVLGLLLAVSRHTFDKTVRSVDALRAASGRPVVGGISRDAKASSDPVIADMSARSVRSEEFRRLRTNLRFSQVDQPDQAFLVTSAVSGEGKSSLAINLALVMAEEGAKVIVVEADLRRPSIGRYLQIESAVGLTDVLAGQVELGDVVQRWGTSVSVLPAGTPAPNPSELLGSKQMRNQLIALRADYDVIIIDSPPLLAVTDAAILSSIVDGTLVMVRYGKTTTTQLDAALAGLDAVDARVIGCVLSMQPSGRRRSGHNVETSKYIATGVRPPEGRRRAATTSAADLLDREAETTRRS